MLNLFNWIGVRWGARLAWWLFAVGLPLLALAAGLGAGAWGAWQLGRAPLHTELAQLRETHSETLRLAQQAAGQRIQAAHAKSDSLALALDQTAAQANTLKQEKTRALQTATAGRVCLSERALSVLHTAPGLRVAGFDRVPQPQPATAAPGGAPATHSEPPGGPERFASDEDIGTWAIAAGAEFETCRARLDALIDWHHSAAPMRQSNP